MATYDAIASHEGDGWVVTVDEVGTTRAGTLEDAGPLAADMVAARLAVDPTTVRVVARTQLPEEIADAVENLQAAAARSDEDPQWYAEANLQARRLLREYGITERDADAVLGAPARPVE
jgi:DNA-binding FadR family transcriptional regulator